MKNVYLFQPQYAVDIRNETNYWLPYSVGCLWSYAQQFSWVTEQFKLKDLFFKRQDPQEILDIIEDPVVCGFSCYVWNQKYCFAMAKLIKERWPTCIIVMGGPQVNSTTLNLNFVDSVILSEGEESFVKLLEDVGQNKKPPALFAKSRLQNLEVPSPYTLGIFDKIIADNPNTVWAMTLETNRGCPYACTFCDWGSATYSKVRKFELDRVASDLLWAERNPVSYIFCADANFGMYKDRDVEIAHMIRATADKGKLESVNIQYAKNSTEVIFTIAKILGDLTRGVTVSVQSMNDLTLEAIKRKNLNINNIKHLMTLGHEYQVGTYTEAILGLPLETLETWKTGLADILEMGQHDSIDVWFCQLLENSELNSFASKVQYGIKTITARDYMPLSNPSDYKEIGEDIILIKATNSMSTDELVEAYMYSWMIIQFHISGYSQIYAKYARNILNINYREFYDTMHEKIKNNSHFGEHFADFKQVVNTYITTGELTQGKGHGLGSESFKFIYDLRVHAFALGRECLSKFTTVDPVVDYAQKNFIYDQSLDLPLVLELPWDLFTWESIPSKYLVNNKIEMTDDFNFYFVRRKGLLKNSFIRI